MWGSSVTHRRQAFFIALGTMLPCSVFLWVASLHDESIAQKLGQKGVWDMVRQEYKVATKGATQEIYQRLQKEFPKTGDLCCQDGDVSYSSYLSGDLRITIAEINSDDREILVQGAGLLSRIAGGVGTDACY